MYNPSTSGQAVAPAQEGDLSSEDRALLERIRQMMSVSWSSNGLPAEPAAKAVQSLQRSGYGIQSVSPIVAQVADGFYVGPFPSAGGIPAGYLPRPVGGWLSANPVTSSSGGLSTTETYYTPGGDLASPPAYSKRSLKDGVPVLDLYASPEVADALPAFFAEQLTLPAGYSVKRSDETYAVYKTGPHSGTALGYRWAVKNASGQLVAWVRALQITTASGSKVDHFEFSTDYQSVGGTVKPTRYAYGTFLEDAKSGQLYDERLDPVTGRRTSAGSWRDLDDHLGSSYTETLNPDGTVQRVFTSGDVVLTENYALDGSGSGTVVQGGIQKATMSWARDQNGTMVLGSGTTAYRASRYYPPVAFGTILATYQTGIYPSDLVFDGAGNAWAYGYSVNGGPRKVVRLSAQGDIQATIAGPIQVPIRAGNGDIVLTDGVTVSRYSARGELVHAYTPGVSILSMDIDREGNHWLAGPSALTKCTSAGTVVASYPVTDSKNAIKQVVASRGDFVWEYGQIDKTFMVMDGQPPMYLRKRSLSGNALADYPTDAWRIHLDPLGFLWTTFGTSGFAMVDSPTGVSAIKYAPTMQEVGRLLNIGGAATDLAWTPDGTTYMTHTKRPSYGVMLRSLYKFSPSGQQLGVTSISTITSPSGLEVDPNGNLWITNTYAQTLVKMSK